MGAFLHPDADCKASLTRRHGSARAHFRQRRGLPPQSRGCSPASACSPVSGCAEAQSAHVRPSESWFGNAGQSDSMRCSYPGAGDSHRPVSPSRSLVADRDRQADDDGRDGVNGQPDRQHPPGTEERWRQHRTGDGQRAAAARNRNMARPSLASSAGDRQWTGGHGHLRRSGEPTGSGERNPWSTGADVHQLPE